MYAPCGGRSPRRYVGMGRWGLHAGVVGGMAACDGAMPLQTEHFSRVVVMSLVIPGQKIEDSALAVIRLVPWCAACRASGQVCRRHGGMMILSP